MLENLTPVTTGNCDDELRCCTRNTHPKYRKSQIVYKDNPTASNYKDQQELLKFQSHAVHNVILIITWGSLKTLSESSDTC